MSHTAGNEREERIAKLLEELRLNTDDLRVLAKQAYERATRRNAHQQIVHSGSRQRAGKKR